jgi:hypothetical protein
MKTILFTILFVYFLLGGMPCYAQALKNPFLPKLPRQAPLPRMMEEETEPPVPPGRAERSDAVTAPPKKIEPPNLKITGIVWNTSRPQAIINERVVSIGDVVSEATITTIERSGIRIKYQGTTFSIPVDSLSVMAQNE